MDEIRNWIDYNDEQRIQVHQRISQDPKGFHTHIISSKRILNGSNE